MLLTLKPTAQNRIKGPHEYSIVQQTVSSPRSSLAAVAEPLPPAMPSRFAADHSVDSNRRGLPPPSSLNSSPDGGRSSMNPMSQLPPAPLICNTPDVTRDWLQAKAEEDRRWQEEEKTRQETLRLEQRRIEQTMLRDSLQSGVPPHMIPLIFAGIGGGSLPHSAAELIQQYAAQSPDTRTTAPLPVAPSQQPPSLALDLPPPQSVAQRRPPLVIPNDVLRDSRALPTSPYAAPPAQQQPILGPALSQPPHAHRLSPTNQSFARPSLVHGPADARPPSLSHINNMETQISHSAVALNNTQYAPGSSVPQSQPTAIQQDHPQPPRQSPPSLYFHHWVPPGQSQPGTSSTRSHQDSPVTAQSQSQRRSEYQNSPGRKRKSQNSHQPPPPPSSRPSDVHSTLHLSRPGSPVIGNRAIDRPTHHRQHSETSIIYDSRMRDRQEPDQRTVPPTLAHRASSSVSSGDLGPEKSPYRGDVPSGNTSLPSYQSHVGRITNSNSAKTEGDNNRSPRQQSR